VDGCYKRVINRGVPINSDNFLTKNSNIPSQKGLQSTELLMEYIYLELLKSLAGSQVIFRFLFGLTPVYGERNANAPCWYHQMIVRS
jgi:hypothetical protein